MREILYDLVVLYRDAFGQTLASLRRAWIGIVAIYLYFLGLRVVAVLAGGVPNPMIAGLIMSLADALAVGALLALLERAVHGHVLRPADVRDALGAYFWNVIAVGFILWIPLMLLSAVVRGPLLIAVSLLIAVFLNPLPEVLYQARTSSPLEDLAESARFVQHQWIEWFLPIALVAAPLGPFLLSGALSRGGLSFGHFLLLPTVLLAFIAEGLGVPARMTIVIAPLAAPIILFTLLLFRGHLFAALYGSSRRQRAFRRRVGQ